MHAYYLTLSPPIQKSRSRTKVVQGNLVTKFAKLRLLRLFSPSQEMEKAMDKQTKKKHDADTAGLELKTSVAMFCTFCNVQHSVFA